MPNILLAIKHLQLDRHNARVLARILKETAADHPPPTRGATAGGDSRKLRGIPAIGRGVSGAIPGTRPEDAIHRTSHNDDA